MSTTYDLKRLVRDAIEKAGGPIVLELKDGGVVRRVRINPDGSIERLWKEVTAKDVAAMMGLLKREEVSG